jgi:hypothetical protein
MTAPQADKLSPDVSGMDRRALIRAILGVKCDFPVDFTPRQLEALSLERLRHIYVALCLHGKRPRRPKSKSPRGGT